MEADRDYLVGVDDGGRRRRRDQRLGHGGELWVDHARRAGIVERRAQMVAIGGDHSISYPLGRGMKPPGEFDVVHVDAHRFP